MYEWFRQHPWLAFVLIYIMVAYVYNKVFRTRKLPVLKSLIVYLLLGVGSVMLLVFQVDAELPIVPCLAVAIGLMFMVRIRYWVQDRAAKK
ncbi:YlaH-like family protein [Paenibacillus thalictri]|uniref:YlaH-like protein n=1 Tax=Paenibacillus thalictri TaxID=2527873 RepID=A0A4V2J495_9BACL|nr:YlaH-like family protein [Paenibacillus thalictri]TBL78118.1 hypothetical protein EYB31_14630 [Paenibacillus thalictri]